MELYAREAVRARLEVRQYEELLRLEEEAAARSESSASTVETAVGKAGRRNKKGRQEWRLEEWRPEEMAMPVRRQEPKEASKEDERWS